MLHRSRRLPCLLMLLLLPAWAAASASPSTRPPPGPYAVLASPERYSPAGQVELVEVFSYDCIHCAEAAVQVDQLRRRLPPQVAFKLVPAMFNLNWLDAARGFYVARRLHRVEATHLALFKARWVDHQPLDQLSQLAGFYAGYGLDPTLFMQLAQSRSVWLQMRHDALLTERWGVDSTPSFIIDGRYRVSAAGMHSYAQMLAQVERLLHAELARTSAPAP